MLEKISDIQRAIETETYLSALALALTLPDICGKIAYPGIKKSGKRYAKWFDEYVTADRYPANYPEERKLCGVKIYKLRCAYLHEGSIEGVPGVDKFELSIIDSATPGMYAASISSFYKFGEIPYNIIKLDVVGICLDICRAAENFYKQTVDKSLFQDANIIINKMRWFE